LKNIPPLANSSFIGELGLSGQVRKSNNLRTKIEEAVRLGIKNIVVPKLEEELNNNFQNLINIKEISNIKEAVELSERLWKPSILNGMDIIEWLKSRNNQERVSISITREERLYDLNQWLRKQQEFVNKKGGICWNVIGPEGGWSSKEIDFFNKNNITFVKLSDTILRTSTASINASSILNQWRIDLKLRN